jgi:hypothetical protein
MHSISTLRALALVSLLCVFAPACATFRNVVRGIDDVATKACELFGTDHPAEFRDLVQDRLAGDGEALDSAQADGFDPRTLCRVKRVLQPFIDNALAEQQALAAAHAE